VLKDNYGALSEMRSQPLVHVAIGVLSQHTEEMHA
jgi:hypothetical protein